MFDRILNPTLPKNLLQLQEGLRRRFPPLGLHKGILDSLYLLILLIYIKYKNQQDEILESPRVLFSLSNTRSENIKNSSTR